MGKCRNIHGHSWNGKIVVECQKLDDIGFGMDFGHLGNFTKYIEHKYDHKLLLFVEDNKLIELCKEMDYAYELFDNNPTSEVIAEYIYKEAKRYFGSPDRELAMNSNIKIHSIVINETCTSECVYYG